MKKHITTVRMAQILDKIVKDHHNGYDSFVCELSGCGLDWYHDDGHHHLTAQLLRELARE